MPDHVDVGMTASVVIVAVAMTDSADAESARKVLDLSDLNEVNHAIGSKEWRGLILVR